MARDFKPSTKSLTPAEQAAGRLRYICRAAEVIQAHMDENGELPPWVLDRVNQSAQLMGMAVSYVSFQKEKQFQQPAKPTKKKPKKPSPMKRKKP